MSNLKLYADASWQSPWVFHVMVALEELGLRYGVEPLSFPIAPAIRSELQRTAVLGKVPCLVDGDFALTESSAITEYLAERYGPPSHPALYPSDPRERARARQVLSFLRTSLLALREERPTSSVFGRAVDTPLSARAGNDADELARVASALLGGKPTLFHTWSIADADLALALMRLVASRDPLPAPLVAYASAQWQRASVRRFLAYIPTTP
ncbi:MAG TPA: glutathione transferase [Kofleriaceae bacterium]|nr:glutathione transferase [Kofleriaceae bacterium]